MSGHPRHPTRNNWWPDCWFCYVMACADCGHLRQDHTHQGGCYPDDTRCECRMRKWEAGFRDLEPAVED